LTARICFGTVVLLTCFYSLFVYIPFTYYSLIKEPFLPWLRAFVQWYPFFYWGSLLLLIADLRRFAARRTRALVVSFAVVHAGLGLMLLKWPHIDCLPHDLRSLMWSAEMPISLLWLGLIDHVAFAESGGWNETSSRNGVSWRRAVLYGLLIWLSYTSVAAVRWVHAGLQLRSLIPAVSHFSIWYLLLDVFAFALLDLSTAFARSNRFRFYALNLLLAVWGCAVWLKLILPTLNFQIPMALAFVGIVNASSAVFVSGLCLCWKSWRRHREHLLVPRIAGPERKRISSWDFVAYLALPMLCCMSTALLADRDWESILQRLFACALWTAVFIPAALTKGEMSPTRPRAWISLVLALSSIVGLRLLSSHERVVAYAASPDGETDNSIEQYVQFDSCAKAIRDVLSSEIESKADPTLLKLLRNSSHLAGTVAPLSIGPGEGRPVRNGVPPHIFIFVLDSLRQDYVAPYNAAVDFTPQITAFAADSVVFHNAFTRYGGTALSEPAIWAGSMLPHEIYPQPFRPMNALQKLVESEGYQPYIAMDDVLKAIMPEFDRAVIINRGVMFDDLDLWNVLAELEQKISARPERNRPLFVYAQPANVHLNGLMFGKKHIRPKPHSPGFDPERATELERVDTAFGEFLAFLRREGLYDDSLIILTSDHGDGLGELGRFGHMGMLYPDVMKIPLIVHLPKRNRDLVYDPDQIAFSIDITPTIYWLLGYGDLQPKAVTGRPLFSHSLRDLEAREQSDYLMESSYAPIYGLLSNSGHELFAIDATSGTTYLFDLVQDPKGIKNHITLARQAIAERKMREKVEELDTTFHVNF
jgi:hypothetical protein